MFFFGHLGIGYKIVSPISRRLPIGFILLGTVLPDLIDKPLYYGLSYLTGLQGAELGMIAGTRSFGHSAVFLIALTLISALFRIRWLAALCLGIATHLLLDNVGDRILLGSGYTAKALVWPLMGWQFPVYPYHGLQNHLSKAKDPYFVFSEVAGALILFWEYWKQKQRHEIASWITEGQSTERKSKAGRSRRGEGS